MIRALLAVTVLATNLYVYHFLGSTKVIPPREEFASFPHVLGRWTCLEPERMADNVVRVLGVSDYMLCDYGDASGSLVNVYVGYHETQIREEGGGGGENSIHPPSHCLPGSGWDIIRASQVDLAIDGLPEAAPVNRLVIAKGSARRLVYYWYQSRGRVVADDWKKILYMSYDRAARGRTDGSLVRFTVPVLRDDPETAEAAFRDVAPQVVARLSRYVPE